MWCDVKLGESIGGFWRSGFLGKTFDAIEMFDLRKVGI